MNRIPALGNCKRRINKPGMSRTQASSLALMLVCGTLLTTSCSASETPQQPASKDYRLVYTVTPEPGQNRVQVELRLEQSKPLLLEMNMHAPADYFSEFAGDGSISVEDDRLTWLAPERGGTLSWSVALNRLKSKNRYDAYMTDDWALFRASDIIPPAATRTMRGARSKTSLSFSLPSGWSSATQYAGERHRYRIVNPKRRFDRPTGWILLGEIGTRTENISGIRVKVAAPRNQDVRRMDLLALLGWTLPEATRLFDQFPTRLTIFSAGSPMWRGGLSAPASLFIHASRPLLSENGTSTLMHEIVHIGMAASAEKDADWIVEGMAEYYGLQLLLRSGTITQNRYARALSQLSDWGADRQLGCYGKANGAVTARATVLMHELDRELRKKTKQEHNLDDVMNVLARQEQKISIADLENTVNRFLGQESEILKEAAPGNCSH